MWYFLLHCAAQEVENKVLWINMESQGLNISLTGHGLTCILFVNCRNGFRNKSGLWQEVYQLEVKVFS